MWRVALDPPAAHVDALADLLSPDERTRATRLRAAERRRRFVVARGVLRTILARYLDAEPASLRFDYGPHGKPALMAAPLRFNLSHSHDLALVAVAREREVGIDVERVRDTVEVARLAARFFSPPEQALLAALSPADRPGAFFRLWTCKEAYLKATGEGMSRALGTLDVTGAANTRAPQVLVRGAVDDRFTLHGLRPDPGYAAALAVGSGATRLSGWRWPR